MRRFAIVLTFSVISAFSAHANTVNIAVDSHQGPWLQSLNSGLDYGVHDNNSPATLIGFDFTAGGAFTFGDTSGLTSAYGGTPYSDAGGDTTYVANNSGGSSGNGFPSNYIPSAQYPVYLMELVGAFALNGVVVGSPFAIGNGGTFDSPGGANQILLGFNDDIFSDNSGGITLNVTGPGTGVVAPVPEPSTWAMMLLGFAGIGAMTYRRRKSALA